MARKTFYSFHYVPDSQRASQVRNMGVVEGNSPVSDNDWEKITNGGDDAIKKWIDGQLSGKSCAIVLAGTNAAGRKWINYEIRKAWNDSKGVVAIHIHNLKDLSGNQCSKGSNPLASVTVPIGGVDKTLSSVAKAYDPPYVDSKQVYTYISNNLAAWADEAVSIRNNN